MATIAFLPYPEPGHMNASFKMAKNLNARGHRVYYLTLADYEEHLSSQGFNCVTIYENLFPKGFLRLEAVQNNRENFAAIALRAKAASHAFDPAKELYDIVGSIKPEMFVVDLLLPDLAAIVGRTGIPTILINTMLLDPWTEMRAMYEPLMNLPELILCPQEFDFPDAKRRSITHYVEASIDLGRKSVAFPWHKVDPDKPLIYCSLGSQSHLFNGYMEFLQTMIDVMERRPRWQLVLAIGAGLEAEEFQPAHSNVLVVNVAPQLEMLKRAAIMISHAGLNSIKESIYFGVPMILFPVMRDQPANAARAVYHGLGVKGRLQKISVDLVQALIDQITTNPSFKARAAKMAERFRELEDSAKGVQIIEAILEGSTN